MRTMKATFENKKCGGTKEANHNDRSFDVSKADNIDDIRNDQAWIFPDGEEQRRVPLQKNALRDFELKYYRSRFGSAIEAQKERYLKARQKSRAESCTVERYYDSIKTGPDSSILQIGKEWEYADRPKFVKAVKIFKGAVEEENEEARIKVLSISVHGSEKNGSLHVHMTKSFEVKDKDGNWVQNQEKCLEKLGYKLPDAEKKNGHYNNRKMTWTEQKRQQWYDIIERVDPEIKIDRTPDPKNPKTKGKVEKAITKMNELKKLIRELRGELEALNRDIDHLGKEDIEKRKERLQKALERNLRVFGKLEEYAGEKAPVKETEIMEAVHDDDYER